MIVSPVTSWAQKKFSEPLILVKNNTYSATNAKIMFTVLKIGWLAYLAYIIYHFYDGGEFDARFNIILFVAIFATIITVGLAWGDADKIIQVDKDGITIAKGKCHGWDEIVKVTFAYVSTFGKVTVHALEITLVPKRGQSSPTVSHKNPLLPVVWSIFESCPVEKEIKIVNSRKAHLTTTVPFDQAKQ